VPACALLALRMCAQAYLMAAIFKMSTFSPREYGCPWRDHREGHSYISVAFFDDGRHQSLSFEQFVMQYQGCIALASWN